jgi:hypothetical protein
MHQMSPAHKGLGAPAAAATLSKQCRNERWTEQPFTQQARVFPARPVPFILDALFVIANGLAHACSG